MLETDSNGHKQAVYIKDGAVHKKYEKIYVNTLYPEQFGDLRVIFK